MKKFAAVRAVFLDRDGVISRRGPGGFVTRCSEIELLPKAADAIRTLNRAGVKVIVVTNQRAISLGLLNEDKLAQIHRRMKTLLRTFEAHVDAVYYCPHDVSCRNCRKPGIGMFRQAFADFPEISADTSVTIGDSVTDIQAARRAGTRTILVSDRRHADGSENADAVAASLYAAVSILIPGDR